MYTTQTLIMIEINIKDLKIEEVLFVGKNDIVKSVYLLKINLYIHYRLNYNSIMCFRRLDLMKCSKICQKQINL